MTSKSLAVHVTSIILGAVAVITLLHPGFVLPAIVLALVPSVCAVAVVVLQVIHDVANHTLVFNLAALEHAVRAITAESAEAPPKALNVTPKVAIELPLAPPGNFPDVNNQRP
jgi:UPF0716 family protein affecting phage T7 exclusion